MVAVERDRGLVGLERPVHRLARLLRVQGVVVGLRLVEDGPGRGHCGHLVARRRAPERDRRGQEDEQRPEDAVGED